MKSHCIVLFCCIAAILGTISVIASSHPSPDPPLYVQTPPVAEQYVGKVVLNDNISVRLLILKHCHEQNAENEQRGIIQAANLAATQGLRIKDIGAYHVNRDGPTGLVWGQKMTVDQLRDWLIGQMKVDAEPGDTLVIYTTGHGSPGGSIQILGARQEVGHAFAQAAERADQETLWWQSSCYAAAGLPQMSEFNPRQQELFSMISSSDANSPSYWGDQTEPMKQVFLALAANDPKIDPDRDDVITAQELRDFLRMIKQGGAKLLFAKSPAEPIFGYFDFANNIPIFGPNGRPFNGPDRYIPYPRRDQMVPIPTPFPKEQDEELLDK